MSSLGVPTKEALAVEDEGSSSSSSSTDAPLYYLIYGASLHPKLLPTHLKNLHPLTSHTLQIPTAFLSFDLPGIPYLSPAFNGAIVQGINDGGPQWVGMDVQEKESKREYRRWVWERCCPGLEFEGELPPRLEGVAYQFSPEDFATISSSSSSGADDDERLIKVEGQIFTHGDPSRSSGTIEVYLSLGGEPNGSRRRKGLQPTLKYLRLILLGAFFSTCSQPYLGHLTLLRPYSPSTLPKKLTSYLFTLLLVPSFLLVHLPSRLLGLRWGRLGTWARRAQEGVLGLLERGLRARVGSGYFNEGEGASAVGRSGESKGRVKDQ